MNVYVVFRQIISVFNKIKRCEFHVNLAVIKVIHSEQHLHIGLADIELARRHINIVKLSYSIGICRIIFKYSLSVSSFEGEELIRKLAFFIEAAV